MIPEEWSDSLAQLVTGESIGERERGREREKERREHCINQNLDCWSPAAERRPKFSQIVEVFDEVLLEALIDDPLARQFWKDHFANKVLRKDLRHLQTVVAHSPFLSLRFLPGSG